MRRPTPPTILLAVLPCLLLGCAEEPEIGVYTTAKPPFTQVAMGQSPMAARIAWPVPGSWQVLGADSIVLDRYQVDAQTQLTVTRLGGTLTDNINRWRGQLLLPPSDGPVNPNELPVLVSEAGAVLVVDLVANEQDPTSQRIRAGILPDFENGQATGQWWFFKMTGPSASIEAQVEAFDAMLSGIRLDSSEQSDG